MLGAPASIIGSELSVYLAPAFILFLAALFRLSHHRVWRGLHFALLCVARELGRCDRDYRSPGRFLFPHPTPARVLLMYTRTASLPSLYIRNIIPIRAPTVLSRVQSKPLPGRARISHPPARPDLFHPTSGKKNSTKFISKILHSLAPVRLETSPAPLTDLL